LTALPLHRVATIIPFIDYLHRHGAPVERELRRTHLPVLAMDDPDCFIPSRNYWTFIANVARHKGMENLGFQVGMRSGANAADPGLAKRLARLPSMQQALEQFCKIGSNEISGVDLCLIPASKGTHRLHYQTSFGCDHPAHVQFEWYGLMAIIAAIRLFAGKHWEPDEIGLVSKETPGKSIRSYFPNTRFLLGQVDCFITLSNRMLNKCLQLIEDDLVSSPRYARIKPPNDFIGAFKLALRSYLRDGAPTLELAAAIVGLSPRTLQRRLATENLSYRQLLVETRYEAAADLLETSTHTITEIASRLSYSDAPHFARAFRSIAGVSPRAYRKERK